MTPTLQRFAFLLVVCLVAGFATQRAVAFVPPWIVDPQGEAAARNNFVPPAEDESLAANRDDFDVFEYELYLTPDFDQQRLVGTVGIQLISVVDGLSFVDLDLDDALTLASVTTFEGDPVTFQHFDDVLRLFPAQPLNTGQAWAVFVNYAGQPQPTGFKGFEFSTTPAGRPLLATLSQPYGARSWWPCKDTPSDKAIVSMRAIVPTGMYAASNGVLADRTPLGDVEVFHWEHAYPISTYNVSLAVAEYVRWQEEWLSPTGRKLPIEYHVFPEDEEDARFDFARTRDVLDYYAELFGEYPFIEEKYGVAEFVWGGAMEHQTMTSYGDVFITGDRFYERIIGHELAHHWWGNALTISDWADLWIHEGFATLAEGLWVERADGVAAYRTFLRRRSNSCCGFPGPISPPTQLFNQTVFNKAAWMLHMLRGLLGDTLFFAAVRDLAERPELQYGSIVTEDVIQQFEDSTGQPLRWFFDQWLYREGRLDFTVDYATVPSGDFTRVNITIQQADTAQPWLFELPLRLQTTNGSMDVETFVSSATQQFTVFVDGDVIELEVDPDEWLLRFGENGATNAPSATFAPARLLPNAPNPFNPRTTLRFELPSPGDVELRIMDARGRLVETIDAGQLPAGQHGLPWDGTDRFGNDVASGVYRVILHADGSTSTARPITLVR